MARKLVKNTKGQNLSGKHGDLGKPPKSVTLPGLKGKKSQTLKRPIQWTPFKAILFLIFVLAPYSALLVAVSGISQMLFVILLSIPVIIGLLIYILYRLTKD